MEVIDYYFHNKRYPLIITYKRIHNIYYRFKNEAFRVSAPYGFKKEKIIKSLNKYAESLLSCALKESDGIIIFGNKYDHSFPVKFSLNGNFFIEATSYEDLKNKFKPYFLNYIKKRVEYYSSLMKLPLYKVRISSASSRWGSNSLKTKTLAFSINLIHFSPLIIDSVIVHELAHIVVFDHSKKFYEVIYKYFPDYNVCHEKLRKKIYQ